MISVLFSLLIAFSTIFFTVLRWSTDCSILHRFFAYFTHSTHCRLFYAHVLLSTHCQSFCTFLPYLGFFTLLYVYPARLHWYFTAARSSAHFFTVLHLSCPFSPSLRFYFIFTRFSPLHVVTHLHHYFTIMCFSAHSRSYVIFTRFSALPTCFSRLSALSHVFLDFLTSLHKFLGFPELFLW